jgi:glyoxylase-like metal-dependent hydrolase (beta-lactamase superfamily II)
MYTVTGYINSQNLVTRTETRVQDNVVGDLLVEFEYSNYQNLNGVQVPTRIVQKQAGMATFDASIASATPNPGNVAALLTAPPPAGRAGAGPGGGTAPAAAPGGQGGRGGGGGQQTPAPPPIEKLGDGAFAIGGNYLALAIDMGDHILVVESGQNDDRGTAVMAAAKRAIPNKPVRFVVNSHPHFDHAGGLAAAVAEGATILTHRNNEEVLERLLSGPRVLIGDSLSKVTKRRTDVVAGVGDRDVRKGTNGKVVELHRVPNEHSDGMLIVYLPTEKIVWSADVTIVNPNPGQLGIVRSVNETLNRLKLDYTRFITTHPPSPDPGRPLTRDDVTKVAGG